MKKIPKLQRAKRGKKYIGSYFVMVDGARVNLDTKNATLALERAKDAAKGTRNFQADHDAAADITQEVTTAQNPPEQPAAATPSPPPPAPPPAAPLSLPPIAHEDAAPAPPPPASNPPQAPAGDWAADAQAAAQETKEQTDSAEPAAATDGVKIAIDPNVLEQMYKVLADFTVEAQLMLQAKAVQWKTGTKPPALDVFFEAHPKAPEMMVTGVKTSKELATACWVQFFRRKFPVDNIPDWAGALILTGGLVSVQYVAAKVTEEEAKRGAAGRPAAPQPPPAGSGPDGHGTENGAGAEAL